MLIVGTASIAWAEPRRVVLRDGAAVEGEILKEDDGRVIVDLGVTVIELPRAVVRRIETIGSGSRASVEVMAGASRLWAPSDGRKGRDVRGNLGRCAPAVVEVRTAIGLGSGFLIHPEGYLVTNAHVVSGEQDFTVTRFERESQEFRRIRFEDVRLVAVNPHIDLALLKIDTDDDVVFPTVPLADGSELSQGETVFAIGSPLGLDRSVSQGILSSLSRAVDGHVFLQTTVPINSGNSGGPLFNLRGEVVGVNNMKLAGIGVEGLSFAIPVTALKAFLAERDAFAFDPRNPNAGFRYPRPPLAGSAERPPSGDDP